MWEFIGSHDDFGFCDSGMEYAKDFPLNIVTHHGLPKGGWSRFMVLEVSDWKWWTDMDDGVRHALL